MSIIACLESNLSFAGSKHPNGCLYYVNTGSKKLWRLFNFLVHNMYEYRELEKWKDPCDLFQHFGIEAKLIEDFYNEEYDKYTNYKLDYGVLVTFFRQRRWKSKKIILKFYNESEDGGLTKEIYVDLIFRGLTEEIYVDLILDDFCFENTLEHLNIDETDILTSIKKIIQEETDEELPF